MSQKFPNSVNSSEPLYHDQYARRHGLPKGKVVVRDTSSKGLRSERTRDPGSKGDSLLARKEVYADLHTPEFSVKTKPKQQIGHNLLSASGQLVNEREQSETWGRILKAQSSNENISGFSKFDPLRTIHFLGKELQSQLKDNLPHDSSVFDVIYEMQNALKRIPHDFQLIADAAAKKQEGKSSKSSHSHHRSERIKTKSECCQTPNMWYLEPVRLQQHLEESSEKIEKACQQMEVLCAKLKSEKEDLEVQLKIEKENYKLVKHQAEDYKVKLQAANVQVESLRKQNSGLRAEVERQKVQLAANDSPSAHELKLFIQDLERTKTAAEAENHRLQEQLHLAHIETEKYEAILEARDLQVKEIRYEMTQLQEVVNEQLLDFQNNLSTSDEAILSNSGQIPQDEENLAPQNVDVRIEEKNGSKLTTAASEPVQELFNNRFNQYDDAHSGGSSTRASTNHLGDIHDLHVDADSLKLRHVYKVPVAGVVGESSSLHDQLLEARMKTKLSSNQQETTN